ncbi:MAG: GNAT family N-acetyltransferase [Jatrophihabitantaceae bacterium]
MGWVFTEDPEVFAAAAVPLLLTEPASNTVALTVLDTLRAGHRFSDQPITLAWYAEGEQVTGAVLMTPPWGLLLAHLPVGSEVSLVEELRARDTVVPDSHGTVEVARRFSSYWLAGTELTAEPLVEQRLFRLGELVAPDPAPTGSARLVTRAELDLLLDWIQAFQDEAESRAATPERSIYERRIDLDLFWFWLDEQGIPVSMAGRNVTIAGVSRVGPVYTPAEHRKHGYAAGVTAACSQHALDTGAQQVVLFTDLANPTSNGIYRRLGYQPLEDRLVLRYG